MPVTVEEVQQFLSDAEKAREAWLQMAEKSWAEIKKRERRGKNWYSRKQKYPAWYSILKIRQPLLLSRVGIPVAKDTTQDGNDDFGAAGAVIVERLATNLVKTFPFFDNLCCARDDFAVTNFGLLRLYYQREEVRERVKEYIEPQQIETGEFVFVDSAGLEVTTDEISRDDQGFFVERDETIDVENEELCLEPVLYKDVYIDPDIRRWGRCKRLAFAEYYSRREYIEIFGAEALQVLPKNEDESDGSQSKHQGIRVFEYWDLYDRECKWLPEGGGEFIEPKAYKIPDGEEYADDLNTRNGIYDLERFFPVPEPLIANAPTDEFWPITEYEQLMDIFNDIHTIFARMVAMTKSIRSRLLYDINVEGLQAALHEAKEGDTFGVSNLAASLRNAGGTLDQVVQYIPVDELIKGLGQLYAALEQRLNVVFKLSGTGDLLQGLITDPTQRTLGERQMTEKYALNQIAEAQRRVQEFVRDCYQLLVEGALKNFKDSSLDKYIMPNTLQPEHQKIYRSVIGMLRSNHNRFRIELETDSTIALNEEYDKKMRVECVNALTAALEKTANIAQVSPALVVAELHALKYLIQGFRQGKMFQTEITQAIDNVIEQAKAQQAPFNAEQAKHELEMKRFELEAQKVQAQLNNDSQRVQIEGFKASSQVNTQQALVSLKQQTEQLQSQIAILELQLKQETAGVEMQNKLADNERLTAQLYDDIQDRGARVPQQPQVVVVPTPAPQGPTIINAPNPAPQPSVVEVPVPVPVSTGEL